MRKLKALYIALLILAYGFSQAQNPVINEIMTMNDTTIDDIEGDSPDWIELFNPTSETMSLENWSLSDDKDNPGKWSFDKEVRIQPYGFVLVLLPERTISQLKAMLLSGLMPETSPCYLSVRPEISSTVSCPGVFLKIFLSEGKPMGQNNTRILPNPHRVTPITTRVLPKSPISATHFFSATTRDIMKIR